MKQLSPLRTLFHDLPNAINGINVISQTFARYIKIIDLNNLKGDIKEEVQHKLNSITDFYKRSIETVKSISNILNKTEVSEECNDFINTINKELEEIKYLIEKLDVSYQNIRDANLKEDLLTTAKELYKLEPKCHYAGKLVKNFKEKLISLGIYYKV